MRRLPLTQVLLLTAVLAAWASGAAAASADVRVQNTATITASVDHDRQRPISFDAREGAVDQSSIRSLDPVRASESTSSGDPDSHGKGRASAALAAAFLLAGVVALLIAAATRVRSSWPA